MEKIFPVLFVGHGSPMNAIENNHFTEGWRSTASSINKPEAVLCISAHWETKGTMVTAMENPRTIHDFGGFPRDLYQVQYNAPGSPGLAREITGMIKKCNITEDLGWGLDHGCWSVLKHFYPLADIPVVQLSLDHYGNPQHHYDLAKELAPLREKGVLIMGSGNMVHNLGKIDWNRIGEPFFGYDWATEAGKRMKEMILADDHMSLINYKSQGSEFNMAIPTPEHFLPLLYILALKNPGEQVSFFNDQPVLGSITMTCVKVG